VVGTSVLTKMASEVEKFEATVLINHIYLSTPSANNVVKGEVVQ